MMQAPVGPRISSVTSDAFIATDSASHLASPTMNAESESLDALSNILNTLSQNPFDLSLHVQHIHLAQKLESFDPSHLQGAREMLTDHFPATDDVWLPLIKAKEQSVDLDDIEGMLDMMELYAKAEADYLCALTFTLALAYELTGCGVT